MEQGTRELICFGRKNPITRLCEYVYRKCIVRKGYILHSSFAKGFNKELKEFV